MRGKLLRIRGDRLLKPAIEESRDTQEGTTLHITNKDSRYRLMFGSEFKEMLEARDQVLEHQFDFSFDLGKLEDKAQHLTDTQLFKDILDKIQQFLLEAISNVTSAAFRLLCKGDLDERQAKQYASKNMMLNIRSIFSKTVTAIKNSSLINQKLQQNQLQELKQQLAIEIDDIVSGVLINLADSYPQAPAAGGTIRMRDAILDIQRVQEEANDLIFAYGIKVQDFIDLQQKENPNGPTDYTKFIMTVVNTAINAANSTQDDFKERSLFEKFSEFCDTLFPLVHHEDYRSFISLYDNRKQANSSSEQRAEVRNNIVDYFSLLLEGSKEKARELDIQDKNKKEGIALYEEKKNEVKDKRAYNTIIKDLLQNKQQITRSPKDLSQFTSENQQILQIRKRFHDMARKTEKGAEDLTKSHKYAMGQKIPAYVKQFSRQEIEGKEFRADHSSVLRVMTKWAENLKEIFQNPEQIAYKRLYPFKTTANEIVHLYNNSQGTKKLIRELTYHRANVQYQEKVLLQNSYKLISEILSDNNRERQTNVRRYSDTRTVASKINAVLTFLMLKYLNLLIRHLIQAGNQLQTDYGKKDINLIIFRVGDLLRSKLQCSETQFISLLKTMYILDESEEMKGKFKLVRIKNKLDDPANNIIINYLFMGRVQCQLQLSIQEPKGKEKNYYIFSHFVYELTRGRFGTIAECAIMISQLDPMVIASKGVYYSEKKALKTDLSSQKVQDRKSSEGKEEQVLQQQQERGEQSDKRDTKNFDDVIFHCSRCLRLVVNESISIFKKRIGAAICNKCLAKLANRESFFKDTQLRDFFKKNSWFKKVKNGYSQVYEMVKNYWERYLSIAKVNQRGKLNIHLVIYIEEELRTMVVRIDQEILAKFHDSEFDFSTLDSIDISKLIKKDKKRGSQELIYIIKNLDQVKQFLKIDSFSLRQAIERFKDKFINFRLEKTTIKSIKAKSEVFNANDKKEKFDKLGMLISMAMAKDSNRRQMESKLLYKKYTDFDFSTIKQIQAERIELYKCPAWLPTLTQLKNLDLQSNMLQQIGEDQLPPYLTQLNLAGNNLKRIKMRIETFKEIYIHNNSLASIDLDYHLPNLNIIYLRDNKLTEISLNHNLPNLKELILFNNKLTSINLDHNLPSLEKVYLNDNELASIDLSHNLPSLTKLYLYNNKLSSIDLSHHHQPNLSMIYLNHNNLTSINLSPDLSNLIELHLNENQLSSIELSQNLPNLKQLTLFSNKLTSITLSQSLPSLTKLYLNDNQLSQIDLSYSMPNLEKLYLYNNKLTSIKLSHELPNLEKLYLYTNKLTSIDLRHNLGGLKQLFLNDNELSSIDLSESMPSLDKLYLQNNKFTSLKVSQNLPNLKQLAVNDNRLTSFELNETMSGLTKLHLANNQLSTIDLSFNFPNLAELYLTKNKLTSINISQNLSSLTQLLLNDNQLVSIELTQNLPNLKSLGIYDNKLASITLCQNLPSLQQLILYENQLTSLDLSSHNMPKLDKLYLYSNKLTSLNLPHKLPNLTKLYLNDNKLTSMELSHKLVKIKKIYLYNNELTSIEFSDENLVSIDVIYIHNNQLASFPTPSIRYLEEFRCDAAIARTTDFSGANYLKQLVIYKDEPTYEELKGIRPKVEVAYGKDQDQ